MYRSLFPYVRQKFLELRSYVDVKVLPLFTHHEI
jgi:hypothetical protein